MDFRGQYFFLSNFYSSPVHYEGIGYPTAEHAYQAAKSLDDRQRARIAALATAKEAKQAGKAVTLRPDWDWVKLQVMETIVRDKFTRSPALARQLLATGQLTLVEDNWWGDTYWGVCKGVGQNHLGKILMRVRDELHPDPGADADDDPWSYLYSDIHDGD